MPRRTSAYGSLARIRKSVNYPWTANAVPPPRKTAAMSTRFVPLRAKTFIHPDDATSINEGCIPDDSPRSFLDRREADLQVAGDDITSNGRLVRCVNCLPDPRGPHPYKLFIWQFDKGVQLYQRLQIPPSQCYNVYNKLEPSNFWMDTAIREVDGWAGFEFEQTEEEDDETDPAEMEKDPLMTKQFDNIMSFAEKFFGFTPTEADHIPELETLSTPAILRQIGLNDKNLHERGFGSEDQFTSFINFFGSLATHSGGGKNIPLHKRAQMVPTPSFSDLYDDSVDQVIVQSIYRISVALDDKKVPHYLVHQRSGSSSLPFTLSVRSAIAAIFVIREGTVLGHTLDSLPMLRLLEKLLDYGIQVNTFVPTSPSIPYPLVPATHELPMRPIDHIFTATDFEEYEARLISFCESTRGRVALTAGGLSWRLGYEYGVGHSSVIRGPCSEQPCGRVVSNGLLLEDNKLSEEEMNVIAGGFHLLKPACNGIQHLLVLFFFTDTNTYRYQVRKEVLFLLAFFQPVVQFPLQDTFLVSECRKLVPNQACRAEGWRYANIRQRLAQHDKV